MISKKNGAIINISSIDGIIGSSCEVAYSASKSAVIGMTKALAKELAMSNITVNAIAPGFILTDMTLALPEATRAEMVKMIPMRRCGEAEEVAKVALFLASDLSSYVSGQVISVNGAMG